ncbi:hypothetical protein NWP96_03360 [Mycoplasmopsis cynos]|nr:hypothetical protein [Mycoplasmopsis cynos]
MQKLIHCNILIQNFLKPTKEKLKQNIENLTVETYPTENKKIDDLNDALKEEIKKIDELFNFSEQNKVQNQKKLILLIIRKHSKVSYKSF